MSHTKKKLKVSRKKVAELAPRDYEILGEPHGFMAINPSSHTRSHSYSMSHRLEKWILLTLLALAMAAFVGFKLLENSDMAFSISDNNTKTTQSANSVGNEAEFKAAFKENRDEARALVQNRTKNVPRKLYAAKKPSKKLVAKKTMKRKNAKKVVKVARKKTIAKR